jgi:hypothetical protein
MRDPVEIIVDPPRLIRLLHPIQDIACLMSPTVLPRDNLILRGEKQASDERILGDGDFVQEVLSEMGGR